MSQIIHDTRPGVLGLPRRRTRARAFFNLLVIMALSAFPFLAVGGALYLAGVHP